MVTEELKQKMNKELKELETKENKTEDDLKTIKYINEYFEGSTPTEILENPEIFDTLVKEIGKKVVGEEDTIAALLLCCLGTKVENAQIASFNILLNAESSAGKDHVANSVVSLFPDNMYEKRTRISPTAFTYWKSPYKTKDGETVNENWTWNGKICYLEDISENVFNHEVFKVMCSSGSKATVVIKQMAVEKEINGKPVMITTSASATPNPELASRFLLLNLDETADQTHAIIDRKAQMAKEGVIVEYNYKFTEALGNLERIKVVIPYADKLTKIFKAGHSKVLLRRHFDRFMDYIKASTALHQRQRNKDINDMYIATGQDYEIAARVLIKVTSNASFIPLTHRQKKFLEFMEQVDEPLSIQEIAARCSIYAQANYYNILPDMVKNGFLKSMVYNDEDRRRDVTKYSFDKEAKLSAIKMPKFEEL